MLKQPAGPSRRAGLLITGTLLAVGCAGHPRPQAQLPPAPAKADGPEGPKAARPNPCRREAPGETELIDRTRRGIETTLCKATFWLDGLLGGEPDAESAKKVSGRLDLSSLYTDADGFKPKARLRASYELPNLERRVRLFLGREDRDQFVEDRPEGIGIRSTVFGLETEEKWLAGLGYSPPGRFASKIDFNLGGRLKTAPEIFVQGRYRRNTFVGDRTVWRFRETVFWENRDGFGTTASLDVDHVLAEDLVFRFSNLGTVSEATDGMSWRSSMLLYKDLPKDRALAGEVFLRGSTGADVAVREYGSRVLFRQRLGRPYLFGNLIAGYTWPRRDDDPSRQRSGVLGVGLEMWLGSKQP